MNGFRRFLYKCRQNAFAVAVGYDDTNACLSYRKSRVEAGAFFIIREKFHPDYEIEDGEDLLEGEDNVLRDQTVRFTGSRNKGNYPIPLRRIVYYAKDLQRTFTYYTNNFYLKASEIALLYKYLKSATNCHAD